jgi:heptaprenyl diphosphate synthase
MLYSGLPLEALIVTLAKTVVGGFLSGTLFSPTTLMSFTGGISAFLAMYLFYNSKMKFSIIGISILGSVSHNLAQLFTVKYVIIKDTKLLYLLPVLLLLGILTGLITGYFAHLLNKQIDIRSLYERNDS